MKILQISFLVMVQGRPHRSELRGDLALRQEEGQQDEDERREWSGARDAGHGGGAAGLQR